MERLQTDETTAVSKLYQDRGYLFSQIEPVEVLVDNDSIDFEMRVYEGKPATINEIGIKGNTRVYEHVVRRELRTKPGQLYSQSDIMRSLRELAQMGHFDQEKLKPDIQPNQEDGTVDITYELETKGSDQVEFSAGWGATGIVGSVGLNSVICHTKSIPSRYISHCSSRRRSDILVECPYQWSILFVGQHVVSRTLVGRQTSELLVRIHLLFKSINNQRQIPE